MPVVTHPVLVTPEHELSKDDVCEMAESFLGKDFPRLKTIQSIIENAGVERRALVRPAAEVMARDGLKASNDTFIDAFKELGERAAKEALERAGLEARDIDVIITTSCTGFMIPSVCAHLIPALGFRRDCLRLPITELGCAAGAVALSRARDFCLARPGANVLVIAGEFCSLCFQPGDLSMQALVGALLFGDGVAATVVRDSDEATGFDLEATGSYLFEGSWDYMGFDVRDSGFHLILDKGVPGAVERQIAPVMKGFLRDQNVDRAGLDFWCLHPGGRKLMDAVERSFELSDTDLAPSRDCLREVGNLSSASVLVVLKYLFERYRPEDGQRGFLAAFGPGFSVEMSLGRWVEA
jgi:1,3,6,8-tetrahydroxynaphthalene synthase